MSQDNDSIFNFSLTSFGFGSAPSDNTDSGAGFVFGKSKPATPSASKNAKTAAKATICSPATSADGTGRDTIPASPSSHPPAGDSSSSSQLTDAAQLPNQDRPSSPGSVTDLKAQIAKLEQAFSEQRSTAEEGAEAAANQIKSLQADLSTGKKIQTALTKELKILQRAKAQAQPKITDLEDQLVVLNNQAEAYQKQVKDLQVQQAVAASEAAHSQSDSQLNSLQHDYDELKQHSEAGKQLVTQLQTELANSRQTILRERSSTAKQLQSLSEQIKQLEAESRTDQDCSQQLTAKLDAANKAAQQQHTEVETSSAGELNLAKAALTKAPPASIADRQQLAKLQAELKATHAELARHAQQLQGASGHEPQHAQRAVQLQTANDDLAQQLQAAKNELAQQAGQLIDVTNDGAQQAEHLQTARAELAQHAQQLEAAKGKIAQLSKALQSAQQEATKHAQQAGACKSYTSLIYLNTHIPNLPPNPLQHSSTPSISHHTSH
ncbi:hypothetical protein WJX79_004289 [Trebouxia sp. C0005]